MICSSKGKLDDLYGVFHTLASFPVSIIHVAPSVARVQGIEHDYLKKIKSVTQ